MKVPYYKGKKRAKRFFREKSGSFKILQKTVFFKHSKKFLVNFLSKDFAQTFRNDNLEG